MAASFHLLCPGHSPCRFSSFCWTFPPFVLHLSLFGTLLLVSSLFFLTHSSSFVSLFPPSGRRVDGLEQVVRLWDGVHPVEEAGVQQPGAQERREGLRGAGAAVSELHRRPLYAKWVHNNGSSRKSIDISPLNALRFCHTSCLTRKNVYANWNKCLAVSESDGNWLESGLTPRLDRAPERWCMIRFWFLARGQDPYWVKKQHYNLTELI